MNTRKAEEFGIHLNDLVERDFSIKEDQIMRILFPPPHPPNFLSGFHFVFICIRKLLGSIVADRNMLHARIEEVEHQKRMIELAEVTKTYISQEEKQEGFFLFFSN